MVFPKQVNSLRKECLFWMWRLYFREAGNILFLFYLKCVVKKQCSTSCDDQDRTTSITTQTNFNSASGFSNYSCFLFDLLLQRN